MLLCLIDIRAKANYDDEMRKDGREGRGGNGETMTI